MLSLRVSSALALAAVLVGCNVYDESLLTTGTGSNDGGSNTNPSSTTDMMTSASSMGGMGTGGSGPSCETPSQCPGEDTECHTRTCDGGVCGQKNEMQGKALPDPKAGDCLKAICDGNGDPTEAPDDTDIEDDGKACTTDGCDAGSVTHVAKASHSGCTEAGNPDGKFCTAGGECVECVLDADCTSLVCNMAAGACSPAACNDLATNGKETDLNCGGGDCPPCVTGKNCKVATDCESMNCNASKKCAESCTDMMQNQTESATDCGGPCPGCNFGQHCNVDGDCASGNCDDQNTCAGPKLLISEVRSRGTGMGSDDFIEIYNAGGGPVTLTSSIVIETRNRTPSTSVYTSKWAGANQVIGAHKHFLIGGSAYSGTATKDANFAGITDEVSIVLKDGAAVLDAVCMRCNVDFDMTPSGGFTCEGSSLSMPNCTDNLDRSFERKPGGSGGNMTDTNNNANDFQIITPSLPQNLASGATP